jgi:hypothetical protein
MHAPQQPRKSLQAVNGRRQDQPVDQVSRVTLAAYRGAEMLGDRIGRVLDGRRPEHRIEDHPDRVGKARGRVGHARAQTPQPTVRHRAAQDGAPAARFAAQGIAYADAPVARTRLAAERGELSIMVGADDATFARVAPYLRCFAREVLHCGPVGAGQVVKLMNNMVLFETGAAIAEALAIARQSGVASEVLLDALSKGSADSFALRNHGRNAMLPRAYPERAFSTRYALKDLEYALSLAAQAGVDAAGARLVRERFTRAIAAGDGERYWPVVAEHIARDEDG